MANAHWLMTNALEAAYKNATHIAPNDLANFIGYAQGACLAMERHHQMEEHTLFPLYETKITMKNNVDQHATFFGGIHGALEYLTQCDPSKPNATKFDAAAFRHFLDGSLEPMTEHLAEELDTLTADIMKKNFELKFLIDAQEQVDAHLKASDPFIFLPLAIYSGPRGYFFPELPWPVKNIVVPILSVKHSGWWKYCWQSTRWEMTPMSK